MCWKVDECIFNAVNRAYVCFCLKISWFVHFHDSLCSILVLLGMLKFRFDKKVVRNEAETAKASMLRRQPEETVSTQVLLNTNLTLCTVDYG